MPDPSHEPSGHRFEESEFLGYKRDANPSLPSLGNLNIFGGLLHLWRKYWPVVLLAMLVGYFLPSIMIEHVLQIERIKIDFQTMRSNPAGSFSSGMVALVENLAPAYLMFYILSKEFSRPLTWHRLFTISLPLVFLSYLIGLGYNIGLLLLIVPGIILYCATIVALPLLIVEDKTMIGSLMQSFEMTDKLRLQILWASIGYYVLLTILILALAIVVRPMLSTLGRTLSFEEIGELFQPLFDIAGALLPIAAYTGMRKLQRGEEPEELASVFD